MGEITGNASTVSIKANLFQCLQEKPKSKRKWEKSNPLTFPSLKAAGALKFTTQGLPCSRQWGGEGGCCSAPQACSQRLHLHVQFWHFHISVRLLHRYLVQGAAFVPWYSRCEGGSLVGGKQCDAQAICNLPTGQWPGAPASPISRVDSNTLTCISLSRDDKHGLASPSSLQHSFLGPGWGYSPWEETPR